MDDSPKLTGKEQQQLFKPAPEMTTRPLGPAQTWSDEYELTLDLSNQPPLTSGLTHNRQQSYQRSTGDDSSLKWSIDYLNQNETKIYEENDV